MSTTDKLKSKVVKTNQPQAQVPAVAKKKLPPLAASILSADFRQQLALALPKTMTADRMARIVVTECNKNTQLYNCDEKSFFASVLQCAALGLEPGDGLGQCYLLPYGKKCQLIIGYRGMIDLARRSGQIRAIFAYCVHQKDHFSYTLGLDPNLEHVPCDDSDPGPTTHVYAVAKLTDGSSQFEVMSRAQVEKIRMRSKASSNGPWTTDWDEMAKKTVVRRLFKYLPVSTEAIRAASADEKSERGEDLDDYDILEDRYIDQGGDVPPPREKPVAEDIEPQPVQEQPEPIAAQPTPIKRESPIPPAPDDTWLDDFANASNR